MFQLRNKKILLLSQQDWGKMFISKHHYAIELAKLGNTVYFMNGPRRSVEYKHGEIRISKTEYEGVFLLVHKFFYPFVLKYYAKPLHVFLLRFHLNNVINRIGDVDLIWSFDVSNTLPLATFPKKSYKIFMPVDEPVMPEGEDGAKGADVLLSVTQEILNKYNAYKIPKLFVNHGVLEQFITKEACWSYNGVINVGISGNFLRKDIDWTCLFDIITANKSVTFNFYGSFDPKNSNLANSSLDELDSYRNRLEELDNVIIHGVTMTTDLSIALNKMDAFLICYDIAKDPSGGTNYHKVLEYMATGRVIVSNNITTYANDDKLVEMPEEKHNTNLPALFKNVITNLAYYNSSEMFNYRKNYAAMHTYANNIRKIEDFINKNLVQNHKDS